MWLAKFLNTGPKEPDVRGFMHKRTTTRTIPGSNSN
jgi:hypothetical protein